MGMNMEQYIAEFTAKGVDGQHLLCMDSSKLKVSISEDFMEPVKAMFISWTLGGGDQTTVLFRS